MRNRFWDEFTVGNWLYGKWYQFGMKLAHRLGFCYPTPTLMDPEYVWCRWCGMRGHKPDNSKAIAAELAEKLDVNEGTGTDA